jgi:hypothetical protein
MWYGDGRVRKHSPLIADDPRKNSGFGYAAESDGPFWIKTLEGELTVSPNDWIIKGVKGEFYPCKPDVFTASYEPAE